MQLNLDENTRVALETALDNYLNGLGFEDGDEDEKTLERVLSALGES